MGEEEIYLFDLQGFIVIEGALSAAEVSRLNAEVDRAAAEGELNEYPRDLTGGSAALAGTPIEGQPEGRHRKSSPSVRLNLSQRRSKGLGRRS